MIDQLRQRLQALQKAPGIEGRPGALPFGIPAIDTMLGGGLARGTLHEIAATGEAHLPAAAGFALWVVALSGAARADRAPSPRRGEGWGEGVLSPLSSLPPHPTSLRSVDLSPQGRGRRKGLFWITEDMALAESGVPHGAGFDAFGLAPEQLVMVSTTHRRDLLWAMEEALRCGATTAVIGEMRAGAIDGVAIRRLSLAAAECGTLALLLRTEPPGDASTAATRWVVGAAPSAVPGVPLLAAQLVRNRRGPTGTWILEWSDCDGQFILTTHAQPLAAPTLDRPHRQIA